MNGSLARTITIATSRKPYDLALDANGTIYIAEERAVTCLNNDGTFRWRTGKNASISWYGHEGTGDGEFKLCNGYFYNPSKQNSLLQKNPTIEFEFRIKMVYFRSQIWLLWICSWFFRIKDLIFLSNGNISW